MKALSLASLGLLASTTLISAQAQAQTFEGHPDEAVTQLLQTLDPPYAILRNVDYLEAQPGQPPPGQVMIDLPNGGVVASDIQDCALRCIATSPCNMASWYGNSTFQPQGNTCWLKELQIGCQYPADLLVHDDDRYLLLARPVAECEGKDLIAPPRESGVADGANPLGTMETPEDKELVLGNRPMDPSVPAVWEIESKSIRAHLQDPLVLLISMLCLHAVALLL